jgi:hypothetical protein
MTDLLDATTATDVPPGPPPGPSAPPPARPGEEDAPSGLDRARAYRIARTVVTVLVVGGAALYTLAQLHPLLLFKDTTPTGGDFGAHVWGPAYLRDHILPHLRLSGWAPDWYAGFPMYHFYMVIPALLVAALDVLVPYGVALKVIGIAGVVTLPVTSWAFGKLGGLPRPVPELFAWAAVFFLFDETFTIYGGNIASTMAGEFSFSIALSLSMLYLGVFAYGMRTGKHRALAAFLFALCALAHLIVSFFAIIGTILLFLLWADRKRLVYLVSVGLVGGLLTAFWILPFWFRGPFMTDMFYERRTDFWVMLFPQSAPMDILINGLAVIGLAGAVVRRYRAGTWLGLMALTYAVWARIWPQSHLWNARLLPFLYLTRYMLVAMGVVEVGRAVGRLVAPTSELADRTARAATLGIAMPVILLALGLHIQNLPLWEQRYDGTAQRWEYVFTPVPSVAVKSDPAFVDDWARWNFSGYEGRDAYGEYYGIVTTMRDLGTERGCGRATWENNNVMDKYGTPMALMLLPFWTDGCIGSMEGLFFESSATTPYHFLSASAVSERSSNPVRRLRYEDGQLSKGVGYLQSLGVRYYLTFTDKMKDQADDDDRLTRVASSGPWNVYEVETADVEGTPTATGEGWGLVQPLAQLPVVVPELTTSPLQPKQARDEWLEVGMSWFQDREVWDGAVPVDGGPRAWPRIPVRLVPDPLTGEQRATDDRYLAKVEPAEPIPVTELPPVQVTDVRVSDDGLSFKVDRVGVPVLVRMSYFPNWKVSGAQGPFRAAPNFMVVVPTENTVRMGYGWTPIDGISYSLAGLGLAGLVVLWRLGPLEYPPPRRRRRGEVEHDDVLDEDLPAWLQAPSALPALADTGPIPVTAAATADGSAPLPVARPAPPMPPVAGRPDLFVDWDDADLDPR